MKVQPFLILDAATTRNNYNLLLAIKPPEQGDANEKLERHEEHTGEN
ncbi:hypothetical protein H6G33_38015 [Calothrix sp. FACHB-1219]|nr:hypothetical protein [Calothrix sp. FACHB-1219]